MCCVTEMLQAQNQRGLAAQAMRELACIHYNTGNLRYGHQISLHHVYLYITIIMLLFIAGCCRGAYQWWSEGLDTLLHMKRSVQHWRSLTSDDLSVTLLAKCGIWGCLLGAILSSNIAQSVVT